MMLRAVEDAASTRALTQRETAEVQLLQKLEAKLSEVRLRPAHILGGWSPSTPRFPTTPWEIVKIHDFPSNLIDFY